MKINVDSVLKQAEIIELLEAQTSPVFKYLGHPNNMKSQLQFEVTDIAAGTDAAALVKGLIKSQPFGKAIFFRVLEDGKLW